MTSEPKSRSFTCATCGETHDDLPDIGFEKPEPWFGIPEAERETRAVLTEDTCVLDDEHYLVRGVLEIPITDASPEDADTDRACFGIGVWVSQKKENFFAYVNREKGAEIGPFFGWLCSNVDFFDETTLHLKTRAHFGEDGMRPTIELEPTDHPLSVQQREGITREQAWALVHHFLSPASESIH